MTGWTGPHADSGDSGAEQSLQELAAAQAGFFTAAQALQVGYSTEMLGTQVVRGSWIKVERDLFRAADAPHTDFEAFAKWCTWFGTAAAVSHQSAAELHGLGHLYPRFIHFSTVMAPPSPTRELALHRRSVRAQDCEKIGPLRITTPQRTALDLAAGGISQELLDEVVADGVAIGRLDAHALHEESATCEAPVAQRIERALATCR
ncbi:MAG: hypothetical protein GX610_04960 [Rhodococcus sp.]|nr:hypothetical protein [Rhodococcus sp. (in: high G+C Gram-positive bacteria)]